MLKMIIQMDDKKINTEKKYNPDVIYRTIDNAFSQMQLPRIDEDSEFLIYCDKGDARDYGRFGRIVNALKKQSWFMNNVIVWRLYNSDDSDVCDDFSEEDLLMHYRSK